MKKVLFISLIIIALPLYGYDLYLLFFRSSLRQPANEVMTAHQFHDTAHSLERLLLAAAPVRFTTKGRDPFSLQHPPSHLHPKKLIAEADNVPKKITPPPITVNGIIWNPKNPVAMIKLPDGSKTLVKTGQHISNNVTVKRISRKSVTVLFGGKEFTIVR